MPDQPQREDQQGQSQKIAAQGTARAQEKETPNPEENRNNSHSDKKSQPTKWRRIWDFCTFSDFRRIELKDRLMILATIGVMLVAGITGWVFVRQENIMQGQLDEMKGGGEQTDKIIEADKRLAAANERFAQAMEDTVANNRDALKKTLQQNKEALVASLAQGQKALDSSICSSRLERRPWVVAALFTLSSEPDKDKPITVTVNLINTGRTPALDLINQSLLLIWPIEPQMTNFITPQNPVSTAILSPVTQGLGNANANTIFTTDPPFQLRENSLSVYKDKTSRLYIHALIRYTDTTNNPHWTRICAYHISGEPLGNFNYCQKGNDVDREPPEGTCLDKATGTGDKRVKKGTTK